MSNGVRCCLLGVCCPPFADGSEEKRLEALTEMIASRLPGDGDTLAAETWKSAARAAAHVVLSQFDLVPKGLGDAIVEAYRLEFAKLPRRP
jgi:hypothetical protein